MDARKAKSKGKLKPEKEMRLILKRINPDLKRLLELVEEVVEDETVLVETIRSGARQLRIARQVLKGKGEPEA